MLVVDHTFTRPNTLVDFYTPADIQSVANEIMKYQETGDIIGFVDEISADNLTMSRTIFLLDDDALARLNSNTTLFTNKQDRTFYNNANGIVESISYQQEDNI